MPKIAHRINKKWRSSDIVVEEDVEFKSIVKSARVCAGLKKAGFRKPAPIQARALSECLQGKDVVIQAKSGTGKTCVYVVTALERLTECKALQVLVIAPTREIAAQIQDVFKAIGCTIPDLKCELFIGGIHIEYDIMKLKDCQIAVGTPGRLKYLTEYSFLKTDKISLLVLDEADRLFSCNSLLLDVGYVLTKLPRSKQTLAVSATYPPDISLKLKKTMKSPMHISLCEEEIYLKGILQFYKKVEYSEHPHVVAGRKIKALSKILKSVLFMQCIVFSNTVENVSSLCYELSDRGFPCTSISSLNNQRERLEAIDCLKKYECKVLVTSDLTCRGIDAENVDLVINLSVPKTLERYLHRIGRAGRYGSRGAAISLVVGESERVKLGEFEKVGKFKIHRLPDPIPFELMKWNPLCASFAKHEPSDLKTIEEENRVKSPENVEDKNGIECHKNVEEENGVEFCKNIEERDNAECSENDDLASNSNSNDVESSGNTENDSEFLKDLFSPIGSAMESSPTSVRSMASDDLTQNVEQATVSSVVNDSSGTQTTHSDCGDDSLNLKLVSDFIKQKKIKSLIRTQKEHSKPIAEDRVDGDIPNIEYPKNTKKDVECSENEELVSNGNSNGVPIENTEGDSLPLKNDGNATESPPVSVKTVTPDDQTQNVEQATVLSVVHGDSSTQATRSDCDKDNIDLKLVTDFIKQKKSKSLIRAQKEPSKPVAEAKTGSDKPNAETDDVKLDAENKANESRPDPETKADDIKCNAATKTADDKITAETKANSDESNVKIKVKAVRFSNGTGKNRERKLRDVLDSKKNVSKSSRKQQQNEENVAAEHKKHVKKSEQNENFKQTVYPKQRKELPVFNSRQNESFSSDSDDISQSFDARGDHKCSRHKNTHPKHFVKEPSYFSSSTNHHCHSRVFSDACCSSAKFDCRPRCGFQLCEGKKNSLQKLCSCVHRSNVLLCQHGSTRPCCKSTRQSSHSCCSQPSSFPSAVLCGDHETYSIDYGRFLHEQLLHAMHWN